MAGTGTRPHFTLQRRARETREVLKGSRNLTSGHWIRCTSVAATNPIRDPTQPPRFFVFGPERSGTTLLAFLLSGQPRLFCINDSFVFKCFIDSVMWSTPERGNRSITSILRILPDLGSALVEGGRPEDWSLRQMVYRGQLRKLSNTYSPGHEPSAGEVDRYLNFLAARYEAGGRASFLHEYWELVPSLSAAMRSLKPATLKVMFSMTLNHLSSHFNESQSADTIMGEKTPVHTVFGKWILDSLYSQSCGIVVVRHPITNISSILKRASSLSAAKDRYLSVSRAMVDLASHPRITVVKYEDLIESPGSTIERVVDAIGGGDFDPALRLVSHAKGAYTGERIDPSRNPQPDDLFSAEERARIRHQFNHVLSAFQYD